MNPLIVISFLAAAVCATPLNMVSQPCAIAPGAMGYSAVGALNYGNALGYAAVGDYGLNLGYGAMNLGYGAMNLGYGAVGAVATPVASMAYAMPEPIQVAAPAVTYTMPEPVQVAAPVMAAPVMQYAAVAPVQVSVHQAPPQIVDTQVHYEHRPVVTGYSSEILKPALGGYVAPLDEPIVSREKVLAPVRTHSQITEQVTVQHPTKINVEKVMYDVEVPTPVAQPYGVPITPQIDVHSVQHVPAPYAVPHVVQPAPVMTYAMPEPIQAAPLMNYAAAPLMSYATAALPCATL